MGSVEITLSVFEVNGQSLYTVRVRGRFGNCTSLKKQSLQSHPPIRGAEAYEAMTNNKANLTKKYYLKISTKIDIS